MLPSCTSVGEPAVPESRQAMIWLPGVPKNGRSAATT
jgi:hypothetical protein